MARLPVGVTGEQAYNRFLAAGWTVARQSASHAFLVSPTDPTRRVIVARHPQPIPTGTLARMRRESGLTADEFWRLLK